MGQEGVGLAVNSRPKVVGSNPAWRIRLEKQLRKQLQHVSSERLSDQLEPPP